MLFVEGKADNSTIDGEGGWHLVLLRFEPFHFQEVHRTAKHISFESDGGLLSPLMFHPLRLLLTCRLIFLPDTAFQKHNGCTRHNWCETAGA